MNIDENLLILDGDKETKKKLVGFAIERWQTDPKNAIWLQGALRFPGRTKDDSLDSNVAPIQKFRWSDYRVYPATQYTYTVHPVYAGSEVTDLGKPDSLLVRPGATVTVKTESLDEGEHQVVFNRAAASSQAFGKNFKEYLDLRADVIARNKARKSGDPKDPVPEMPQEALDWLSRGLLEKILGFIAKAKDGNWRLDIAIYEYELPKIIKAVKDAQDRGVKVRVVYHAKPKDAQTALNEANLKELKDDQRNPATVIPRVTKKICHHKFIVLSEKQNGGFTPQAVLCGSTNFTENGVYRQANVVHVIDNPDVALQYEKLFEQLVEGREVKATKVYIDGNNKYGVPLIDALGAPAADFTGLFVGFSPRNRLKKNKKESYCSDLKYFADVIRTARRDIMFCTAFDLDDTVESALLGEALDPILRFGLQNQESQITGYHADRTANFTAAATLPDGLEGWIAESTVGQKGNILIHTKMVILDFTSESPLIISGSHNLSQSASKDNDENYLILRGAPGVADTYGCEFLRLYDHYRFRFAAQQASEKA
jgi:phosphatidylserine/phosphatidylglycerophosphate/cardiolipin synthase-like enzyme